MTETAGIIATVLAIAGVVLNNRLNRLCFILWIISNLTFLALHADAVLHVNAELWPLCVRDAAFTALAIEGFYRWGRKVGQ